MLTPLQTCERLYSLIEQGAECGFDTEGLEYMTCCGFATRRNDGTYACLVVDTLGIRKQPYAADIWQALRAVIESPRVRKVCWAADHERAFLELRHSIRMTAFEDAMFAWHELYPELPKGLKYAASLLTRIPCWTEGITWKEDDDRPAASGEQLWRYNSTDCVATLKLWHHAKLAFAHKPANAADTAMSARYTSNLHLIEPFNYASQRGVLYDHEQATRIREELTPKLWEAQAAVDEAAGVVVPQGEALLDYVRTHCCVKRHAAKGLVTSLETAATYALKAYQEVIPRVAALLGGATTELSKAARGELAAILDIGLNVKSTPAVLATLNRLGLPPVMKKVARGPADDEDSNEPTHRQTKEAAALLAVYLRKPHPILTALLTTIALRGRMQELARKVDEDGRIRSSYTICGPSTDRTASRAWLTGSGGNAQTVPREPVNFRVCYLADPGHDWYKLDLTGADLWTVACRVSAEGDRTLLDDLLAGIRIPSLVGLMMNEGYRPGSDRAVIRADCIAYRAALKARHESWIDTVMKIVSHLSNYGGKPAKIRETVIKKTYQEAGTPIDPGVALCTRTQGTYMGRYWGLPRWWARVQESVVQTGKLVYATGRERQFFSARISYGKLDDATCRTAYAAEPQHITCHIIKTGLLRLWSDLSNWPSGVVGAGDPICKPAIPNVHDECTWTAPVEARDYNASRIHPWFDVPLRIGKDTVTIPFEACRGDSWGNAKEPVV